MINRPIPRLDRNPELHQNLLKHCRLKTGDIWEDPDGKHRVGCLDATNPRDIIKLMNGEQAVLAIQDPPYNQVAFKEKNVSEYIEWCGRWIKNSSHSLTENSSLYVWLGADQNNGFQPLPDFIIMMRDTDFRSRSFITVRNQRGYGTRKNWMAVRQELLYYIKGKPTFNIDAVYTDIPKILRGYYKEVKGKVSENIERSRSDTIRAGNVWVDIQQVFYRMEENVNGCYTQKPLKAIERIIKSGSVEADLIIDFFAHSGSTLISAEIAGRRCFTCDIDPIFCEITIRRLEQYRDEHKTGWQNSNPFDLE